MMKKISSIRQLKTEKKRITRERDELEHTIKRNWIDLRETIKPSSIAKDALQVYIENRTEQKQKEGGILKSAITYGLTLLAKKFADKAGNKLNTLFKK